MKILVTGASGLLGLNLALMGMEAHTIVGADRSRLAGTPFELIKGTCSTRKLSIISSIRSNLTRLSTRQRWPTSRLARSSLTMPVCSMRNCQANWRMPVPGAEFA